MAYVVGLMATDGCLWSDGRHLSFDSNDRQLIETFLSCLGRPNRYRTVKTRAGNDHFQAAFGDVAFYRWLVPVGLTPRKSLTIGPVHLPEEFFVPLVRGLFDGDGSIANFVHAPTRASAPSYRYERLWVFFNSGSRRHLEWLRGQLKALLGLEGYLDVQKARSGKNEFYRLRLGNHASQRLLTALYDDPAAPRLERKWQIWAAYRIRHPDAWAVPREGLEPSRPFDHSALNATRLPITPPRPRDLMISPAVSERTRRRHPPFAAPSSGGGSRKRVRVRVPPSAQRTAAPLPSASVQRVLPIEP